MRQTIVKLDQRGNGLIGGLVAFVFSVIIGIVAVRFIFRLIGANPDNGIVSWFYSASQPLVQPFFGIFGHDINVATGRFEFDTLIALLIYGIIASIAGALFGRSYRSHS